MLKTLSSCDVCLLFYDIQLIFMHLTSRQSYIINSKCSYIYCKWLWKKKCKVHTLMFLTLINLIVSSWLVPVDVNSLCSTRKNKEGKQISCRIFMNFSLVRYDKKTAACVWCVCVFVWVRLFLRKHHFSRITVFPVRPDFQRSYGGSSCGWHRMSDCKPQPF